MEATGSVFAAPTELPLLWSWTWVAVALTVFLVLAAASALWLWFDRSHGHRGAKAEKRPENLRPPSNSLPHAA